MSDTNFKPASSTGYGAGSGSGTADMDPQYPRGSGMSYEAQQRQYGRDQERHSGRESGYMDQASEMADEAWRTGRDYYEQGSRRVTEWADEHPNQLWAAIAIAGAFALWMAYRPIFGSSRGPQGNFDPSRYRYRRLSQPQGRAAFMERGAVNADRRGRGI